jgi:hypothetical protein
LFGPGSRHGAERLLDYLFSIDKDAALVFPSPCASPYVPDGLVLFGKFRFPMLGQSVNLFAFT